MVKAKAVDSWKEKSWFTVYAPEMFDSKEIAKVVSNEEEKLLNRTIQISLADLTGDMSQTYTLLLFRIVEVKGKSAHTKLIGHELSRTYLRTLVRRRRNIIGQIVDVTTKDGVGLRLKIRAYSNVKLSTAARTAIRNGLTDEALARAKEMDFSQLEQEIVFGKFPGRLFGRVKKIAPLRRVEAYKTEVKEVFEKAEK